MRTLLLAALALFLTVPASAISLQEAQDEADAWVAARWTTIKDRVQTCIQESTTQPKGMDCHTAWAAAVENYCENNAGTGATLCSIALNDPGQWETACGGCYNGLQTFAGAGIVIPANAPLNATINIALAPGGGRGEQLIVRFQYDGVLWERGYGDLVLPGFDWREVQTGP